MTEVLVDDDRSAYSGKPRPSYERLLEGVRSGEYDGIVAWHPDRLHRSPKELETFIDLIEATKVKVATVQAGEYDLSTPSGRMTARVVGAVARHESEHKSERLRRKHLELAEGGKVSGGGTRPYGFEDDRRRIRKAEARVIQAAAKRVLAGETLHGVAADLNRRGVPTVTGTPWTTTVLRRVLTAWRTCGVRSHHDEPAGRAEWPAILERETVETLRAIILDPARRVNRSARRYLLTGLAFCGLCGEKLVARPRTDKRRAYVCSTGANFRGCGKIGVLADPLEDHVVDQVLDAIADADLADEIEQYEQGGTTLILDEVRTIEDRLAQLARDWAEGDITRGEWVAAREALESRLHAARSRLRDEGGQRALEGLPRDRDALRARWAEDDMTFDRKRAVLRTIVDRVEVGPAVKGRNFFDGERVKIL